MKVTNHTRASKKGKQIACPKCNSVATVYHFAWSALGCQTCKEYINKYDWEVKNMCQ